MFTVWMLFFPLFHQLAHYFSFLRGVKLINTEDTATNIIRLLIYFWVAILLYEKKK
jgi:hypothetical protein